MMINYCFVTIAIEGKFEFDLIGVLAEVFYYVNYRLSIITSNVLQIMSVMKT